MNTYIVESTEFGQFIDSLLAEATVIAPMDDKGVVSFQAIEGHDDIVMDYTNTPVPPKKVLFPQTETLFSYQLGRHPDIEAPEAPSVSRILFGIRPCDARSISMLDKVFDGAFQDVYYLQKRQQTALIGLACDEPCLNCFCTSVAGGPASHEGLDVLVTKSGEAFALEAITEKGQELIGQNRECLREASEQEKTQTTELHAQAETNIQRRISTEDIKAKLDELFYHPVWNELTQECVGCSVCTFLCPTCHCFDIQDENFGSEGKRVRMWDSCSNPEYTMHASGHNPRPGRMHRTRNRLYHKYSYFPENHEGQIACVGCGRCIEKCPVNIDILEMLRKVKDV